MKQTFVVDSGMYLVIDPAYLKRFMKHFNYDEFATSSSPKMYVNEVAKKAYPKAREDLVALVEVGDGVFVLSQNNGKVEIE